MNVEWTKVEDGLPKLSKEGYASAHCLVTVWANKPVTLAMDYQRTIVRGKIVERWEWNNRIVPCKVRAWMYYPEPLDIEEEG